MLSRVADSLCWMGRHIERAAFVSRLTNSNHRILFDLPQADSDRGRRDWHKLVECLALESFFRKTGFERDFLSITEFLVWHPDNPSSIYSAIRSARENARAVREQISTEMWEQVNCLYWWMNSKASRQVYEKNPYDFFEYIHSEGQLFEGITNSTLRQGEAWDFIQLGKNLERADGTTRALDEKFHLLAQHHELLQSLSVLRICGAVQAYQQTFHSDVTPIQVAKLLILDASFPRSVIFCLRASDQALRRISGVQEGAFSNEAEKISGRLCSSLIYSRIEDLWSLSLHRTVDDLQAQMNALGIAIFATYINRKEVAPETPYAAEQ